MAALVWWFMVWRLKADAHVSLAESMRYTGYVGYLLVLPGTLVWRAIRSFGRRDRRPLMEDLALGTVLGFAMELPVYLACRAMHHPAVVAGFPIVIVLASLTTPSSRRLWTSALNAPPIRLSARAAVAAASIVDVGLIAAQTWAPAAEPASRLAPYVDEPYHLALVTEFSHHVPAQVPFVSGVPLYYHWLTYVHLASASWVSGIEAITLLQMVSLPVIILVTMVAVMVVGTRLSGNPWIGVLAMLCFAFFIAPSTFTWGLTGPISYLSAVDYGSPTQVFANLFIALLMLLLIELLRGTLHGRRWWVLTVVLMFVIGGSKSSALPILICGLAAAAGLAVVAERRLDPRALGLAGLGVVAFFADQKVFYGPGSRALTFSPFHAMERMASDAGLTARGSTPPWQVTTVLLIWVITTHLVLIAGALGYLLDYGWRDPVARMLIGIFLSGLLGVLAFGHPSLSEYYFLRSAVVPAALLSALGLARVAQGLSRHRLLLTAGAIGILLSIVVPALASGSQPDRQAHAPIREVVRTVGMPTVWFWLAVSVTCVGVTLATRSRGQRAALASVICVLLGLGFGRVVTEIPNALTRPTPAPPQPTLPLGGMESARWIRAHAATNDLVATNAHCGGRPNPGCDHRAFWVAGYTERRVLVEGWAYIPPESVGRPSDPLTNSPYVPFWDEARLTANDEAFSHPSPATLGTLKRTYGVSWLLVDLRYPRVDLANLKRYSDLTYTSGQTVVLRLRNLP